MALIAGSIREFGFTNPVLVDGENGIIAGHGRVLAARKLGLASVPVIELGHLTEAQKRAYILADNKLAERAGWDRELLALELGELAELGTDLGSLGFEALELDALLGNELPDPREEETPEPPVVPVSRPGDLWLLGPHRLLCGSSTEAADVARLLGGVTPLLMVSDPPYGVAYDPSWRNRAGAARTRRTGKVLNDEEGEPGPLRPRPMGRILMLERSKTSARCFDYTSLHLAYRTAQRTLRSSGRRRTNAVIGYERVSTARQGASGLGMEAQRQAIEGFAAQRNADLIARFTEVESGRNPDRPELGKALHLAKVTGATLVIAKLDRLSRNAAFLLTLRDSGVRFAAVDY